MPSQRRQRPLPLHLVGETSDGLPIVVQRRRRGRPRQVALAPDQQQYEAEAMARLDELVEQDAVVNAVAKDKGSVAVVSAALEAMAMEVAGLKFEKLKAARGGRDIADLSGRRIRALARLADLVLVRHQLDGGQLDLDGRHVEQVESMWLDAIQEVAVETLADPEPFMARVKDTLVGWRERLRPLAPRWCEAEG